ncbi:MAG: hypothetical protein WC853_07930 [Thermodesulfovibrionales bacterium]
MSKKYPLISVFILILVMTSTFVLSDDKKKDDFSMSHGRLPMEERVNILDVSPFTNDVVYGLYVNNEDLTL